MISVKVNDNKITIKGHAMFADYGKDIVCSACSSIVTTTVNGCLSINRKSIEYDVNSDGMEIIIKSNDDVTSKLITNMVNLLQELENNYPDNIKVK